MSFPKYRHWRNISHMRLGPLEEDKSLKREVISPKERRRDRIRKFLRPTGAFMLSLMLFGLLEPVIAGALIQTRSGLVLLLVLLPIVIPAYLLSPRE